MVKKESAKRGYMTKEEVKGHLDKMESVHEKIKYLDNVSRRTTLSHGTQESIYENLCETYLGEGSHNPYKAYYATKKLGKKREKYYPQILDEFIRQENLHGTIGESEMTRIAEELSLKLNRGEDVMRLYLKAAPGNMRLANAAKTFAERMGKPGDKYLGNLFDIYKEDLIDCGRNRIQWIDDEKIEQLATKLGKERELLEAYIEAGGKKTFFGFRSAFLSEAVNLAKKLGKVEQKKVLDAYISRGYAEKAILLGKEMGLTEGEILASNNSKSKGLEQKVSSVIAITGVLGGIFFLSNNITGNAITNISPGSGNIIGVVLLMVGLVAGFFWMKKK